MALYEFEGKRPSIGRTSFVPESADIIGDVVIGEGCFVGVGARLRGDYGRRKLGGIGDRTSVQENVVIHVRENGETRVGSNVQLGHGCILHNCTVKDNAVIGVGAILTDDSVVGDWAIVGEGAVVRGQVPDGTIAVGVPAKVIGEVTEAHKQEWQYYKDKYAELASARYPAGFKRLDNQGSAPMIDLDAEQIVKRLRALEQEVKSLAASRDALLLKLRELENAIHAASDQAEFDKLTKSGKPIIPTDHPLVIRVEGVRGGEPITRHAYVSVQTIVELTRLGETPEQIQQDYAPFLSLAEVSDALSYYLHHQAEIDGYISENNAALERASELSRLADERKRAVKKI